MALDCKTCDHKKNVATDGHCSEFVHIPDLDKCEMHTQGARAAAVAAAPTGSFIWLGQGHSAAKEVQTPSVTR
jgi:hypothetical protein